MSFDLSYNRIQNCNSLTSISIPYKQLNIIKFNSYIGIGDFIIIQPSNSACNQVVGRLIDVSFYRDIPSNKQPVNRNIFNSHILGLVRIWEPIDKQFPGYERVSLEDEYILSGMEQRCAYVGGGP